MTKEVPVLYERTEQNGPALVLQVGNLEHFDYSVVERIITSTGLSVEEFRQLITLQFNQLEGTIEFEEYNDKGEKIEDIVGWTADTSVGIAGVEDIKLYPTIVKDKDNTGLHFKMVGTRGFEVVYVKSGKATLTFPQKVDPVAAGVYVASKERTDVELTAGTLAIIPAPTANGWTHVSEGFEFRYICQPPWSEDIVAPALDQ